MDLSSIGAIKNIEGVSNIFGIEKVSETEKKTDGTLFESFLNSAIDNIKTTNAYLSDAENEEIKFALGETENTHDLTIALQKASTALQYTVAIRNKLMEAYKEIMQIQI